jgi:hypothetical protein
LSPQISVGQYFQAFRRRKRQSSDWIEYSPGYSARRFIVSADGPEEGDVEVENKTIDLYEFELWSDS